MTASFLANQLTPAIFLNATTINIAEGSQFEAKLVPGVGGVPLAGAGIGWNISTNMGDLRCSGALPTALPLTFGIFLKDSFE